MTLTTTVHLRAGTPEEYLVGVTANVSLFAGRYRIDKLEVTGDSSTVIAPRDLDDAYEQIIEAARPKGLADPARRERGSVSMAVTSLVVFAMIFLVVFGVAAWVSEQRAPKQTAVSRPPLPSSSILSFTSAEDHATFYSSPNFFTTKHDNHWFVTAQQNQGIALLHHPDCPCRKGIPLLESSAQGR